MADSSAASPTPPPRAVATEAFSLFHPDPSEDDHWAWLEAHLGGHAIREYLGPLRGVLKLARGHRARTVVVEERYVDIDYRSEHTAFWSKRFEDRTGLARRVHFFAEHLDPADLHRLSKDLDYIGYAVARPTALGPLGRTIIRQPNDISQEAVFCSVADAPSLFGADLEIEGVPFCQQDGEHLRCAHAAAWSCHYVAQARGIIARRPSAALAELPATESSKYRPLPSSGLTGEQLQTIFSAIGLPAFFWKVEDLPDPPADLPKTEPEKTGIFATEARRRRAAAEADEQWLEAMQREKLLRIACKYINSGFPIVVLTEGEAGHAFVVVGWERVGEDVHLFVCDDQVGPYERITDVLEDQRGGGRWVAVMVPLPEKVYLTGEAAEQAAWNMADAAARLREPVTPQERDFAELGPRLRTLRAGLSARTKLMRGRDYKANLTPESGRTDAGIRLERLAHLSNWVWVVELQDTALRDRGQACVLAEFVFDSTSHDDAPLALLSATKSITRDNGAERRGEDGEIEADGPGRPWASIILPPAEQLARAA